MTEGTPLSLGEIRQLNRDLLEKVIDKAASDPEWKQRLLDDPEAAMRQAGFSEVERLREVEARSAEDPEVNGQMMCGRGCFVQTNIVEQTNIEPARDY